MMIEKAELLVEMFHVAEELGGVFSTSREANNEARFEAKDLIFGRPEQAVFGVGHYTCASNDADERRH